MPSAKPLFGVLSLRAAIRRKVLRAIDIWVGRTLFVPLIVRFCQRFKWSQFHVHNYLYLVGSLMMLIAALSKGADDVGLTFFMALVFVVKAGRDPGYIGDASTFLRRTFLFINVLHVAAHLSGKMLLLAGPNWDMSCPVPLMWLIAEYARTIKTIPPLEESKPASQQVVTVKAKVL